MRARFVAAALAALSIVPAAAGASLGVDSVNSVDSVAKRGEPVFSFKVVKQGGDVVKVKKFRFREVTVTCLTGPNPQFDTFSEPPHFGPFSVNGNGKFSRTFTSSDQNFDGTVRIAGEFQAPKRAAGTLRIQGDYPAAGYSGCDSGRVDWTVRL